MGLTAHNRDVWLSDFRVGDELTSFSMTQTDQIVERTGIASRRRQRRSTGVTGITFSLAGHFDPDRIGSFGVGERVFELIEAWGTDTLPADARVASRVKIPGWSYEHPVEDFVSAACDGESDLPMKDAKLMAYRQEVVNAAADVHFETAANGGLVWDQGSTWPALGQAQQVRMRVHVESADITGVSLARLILRHSHDNTSWINAASVNVDVEALTPPDSAFDHETSVAGLRRYLSFGLDITAGAVPDVSLKFSLFLQVE